MTHLIAICGGSGSGKTFISRALRDNLPCPTAILSYDSYYRDQGHLPVEDRDLLNYDDPAMLDEERLHYVGSMVLGLSDALVELTGTLAGLTFALADTRLVALSGLITGVSATLSMASSEFLSARSEGRSDALKSCLYTGVAYLITVALMILPYLLLSNSVAALVIMLVIVVAEIALFNYYTAVAQDLVFKRRFLEMAGISLGVAVVSFLIGLLVKAWLGIDV